ncbi:acyltransferase domain-containing protein [Chromobacterium piscinae]|uniref:Acyltransferase domain-containing protein n=1 Tax=Chromobacterium piscinae TaxID=686831 RepID=A0ABV0H794_9NEIS|nr:acyltransferase domain-containing protein [Chromobacterium piscinae]MCD4505028.1 acyltransferase domain-containing protein [Chromobacterium piscinae]MCD5330852.1 acyltransferase domain-containing protein [Chromobacterium piscinae]
MKNKPIVFLFSGQGSQYYTMGMDLYASNILFRRHMDSLDKIARDVIGHSPLQLIDVENKQLYEPFTDVPSSSVAIYLIERALTRCLIDYEIEASIHVASSMGIYAAATAAGCMDEAEALNIVFEQGKIFRDTCEPGKMIAVLADPALFQHIPGLQDISDLAGINFDNAFVISATSSNLPALNQLLKSFNLTYQEIQAERPFHSRWILPAKQKLDLLSSQLSDKQPRIPLICCSSQNPIESFNSSSIWNAVRQPIMFRDTILQLEKTGPHCYIDVGPSATMATLLKYALPANSASESHVILSPLKQSSTKLHQLLRAANKAHHANQYHNI